MGRLESNTGGGNDGPLALRSTRAPGLEFLQPVERRRTIGEVRNALEHAFGKDLELVDEEDFLRTAAGSETASIRVRVRFHRPDMIS